MGIILYWFIDMTMIIIWCDIRMMYNGNDNGIWFWLLDCMVDGMRYSYRYDVIW